MSFHRRAELRTTYVEGFDVPMHPVLGVEVLQTLRQLRDAILQLGQTHALLEYGHCEVAISGIHHDAVHPVHVAQGRGFGRKGLTRC